MNLVEKWPSPGNGLDRTSDNAAQKGKLILINFLLDQNTKIKSHVFTFVNDEQPERPS